MKPVPRLKPGWMFKGPEFTGCFNTGKRPVIFRLGSEGYDYKYIVGPQLDVELNLVKIYMNLRKGFKGRKMTVGDNDMVWAYKTRNSALKKFNEMRQVVVDYNEREKREIEEKLQKSKEGNVEATLSLGLDHGVLG